MISRISYVVAASILLIVASVAVAPASAAPTLFAVESTRALSTIDMTTGMKTPVCTLTSNVGTPGGLTYDPSSGTVYVSSSANDSLYTLNLDTCEATLVGPYGDSSVVMHGLEYDTSTGQLYGGSGGNLYTIDKNTGTASIVGLSGLTSFLNLGYRSANDTLYATNSNTDSFYSVDRGTGAVTLIGPLVNSTNPNGLAYDPVNDILFLTDNTTDSLYQLNVATGEAVLVGSTGSGNILGLVYIPEPGTALALCLGAAMLLRRRR